MTPETCLFYLGILAAFFATPPDTSPLLIMSNAIRHGLRRTLASVAGDVSANALQMTAAAFGLTAIIAVSADALWIVKWLAVAYLAWIGATLLLSKPARPGGSAPPPRRAALFRQGFLTSSATPCAVVFFGALFPQFIDPTHAVLPQLLILGTTYLVAYGLTLVLCSWVARSTLGHVRTLHGVRLNRVSDALMIGAAAVPGNRNLAAETAR